MSYQGRRYQEARASREEGRVVRGHRSKGETDVSEGGLNRTGAGGGDSKNGSLHPNPGPEPTGPQRLGQATTRRTRTDVDLVQSCS